MQVVSMYYEKYFPFYVAHANPFLYNGEKIQEDEYRLMKNYYPVASQTIQQRVEEECEALDYEGSRMYDEYPDKFMLYHTCQNIRNDVEAEVEAQGISGPFLDELIQVLFYHEMTRRRCRRHRCRKYF